MRTRTLLLLTLAAGCSGTERTDPIGQPDPTGTSGTGDAAALSAKAWCGRVFGTLRGYYVRCYGGTAMDWSAIIDEAQCDTFEADVRAARLAFDATRGAACNSAVQTASCGFDGLDLDVCEETFAGAVPAGESCTDSEHCVAGTRCAMAPGACSGSCTLQAEAGPGDVCAEASCGDGLFCQYSGAEDPVCRAYGDVGALCSSTFECASPLWCDDDGACAQPMAAGAACSSSFRQCGADLICAGPVGARACRTPKKVGEACTRGDGECTIGYCSAAGVCTFPPGLGEACGGDFPESADCTSGYCNAGGTCAARKADGQACEFSDECASFDCTEGMCQPELCPGG